MAATRLIAMHQTKGRSIAKCLKNRTDYAKNEKKTDGGELVSSYECDPKLVEDQFLLSKREYAQITGRHRDGDVIAYQIRQSFKPGEVAPEEANRIGYETAMRWTKGEHAFIVATHIDKAHIHNHIIYNSTNLDCDGKYRDFFRSGKALQKVSDLVCLEHGLSVIKRKKKWYEEKEPEKTLESDLQKEETKMDMVLDLQEIMEKGKGPGYEHWAKIHNIKEMAQTLLFLEEHGLTDYAALCEKVETASRSFDEIGDRQKNLETRMKENREIKQNILLNIRTKEVYAQYRKGGYQKKFFEEHREELTLHKASSDALKKLGGNVPKLKDLDEEYRKLSKEKNQTYAEYKQAREEMKQLQVAKYNVDRFLRKERAERPLEKQKQNEQTR